MKTIKKLFALIISALITSSVIGPMAAIGQVKTSRRPAYTVADLGTLAGGNTSFGFDMNNAGAVGGSSNLSVDDPAQHAVIWYRGQTIDLGTLGGPNSAAGGPNANFAAPVNSETALADPLGEAFCGFGNNLQCLAAVWRNGVLTSLPLMPNGRNSQAYGINDAGQIVGFAENAIADDCATPFQARRFEPVIWDADGQIRRLQIPDGDTVAFAFGINNSGQSVGGSGLCSNTIIPPFANITSPHATLWNSDGSAVDLGNLGGAINTASAINNRGDVSGAAQVPEGPVHAFMWTSKSGMQDLGTLAGDFLSVSPCCSTINDSRQVVGFSIGENGPRAFIWDKGQMTDLNELVAGSPLYLLFAQAINERGQITGFGVTETGELHAFLATPTKRGS